MFFQLSVVTHRRHANICLGSLRCFHIAHIMNVGQVALRKLRLYNCLLQNVNSTVATFSVSRIFDAFLFVPLIIQIRR
jgi:hypothetical protein